MTNRALDYEFVRSLVSLTWREAYWGYQHGLIRWEALKDLAGDKLVQGSEKAYEIELAGLSAVEAHESEGLAKQLADQEMPTEVGRDQQVWLFLVLADLYLRRNEVEDAFADIEVIYADFGYPEEIEGFVRFMPPSDGYEPLTHSHQENLQRSHRLWVQYLQAHGFDTGVDASD
ncbi:DUF2247 family protein [Lysobacter sp. A6]|uniref:DUF2247 family protein n=1 Tax=Noviluteimonas lactosilytica TaxID=2888523 RepID=A0ABS8JE23_9GAMM|nr:DUF2247 family protein [Lysobacter lactosilyticus]MCC8361802.1 DUF2247 family protein [Lysobacter lactosilyticus]